MSQLKRYLTPIFLITAIILSGCQNSQKAPIPTPVQSQSQVETPAEKPCGGQPTAKDPWIYKHHAQWDLPGAAVPEVFAAAKKILIEEWKMPANIDRNSSESRYVDFLSASFEVQSALSTAFTLSVVKLNENTCRLAIDAKSAKLPEAQLEEHCFLMHGRIVDCLNEMPQQKQERKRSLYLNNINYYLIENYSFDAPVKETHDAAAALLKQMSIAKVDSSCDDLAARIGFRTGNHTPLMMELNLAGVNTTQLSLYAGQDSDLAKSKLWGDILVDRLRQYMAEPPSPEKTSEIIVAVPAPRQYYGQGRSPSVISKGMEYPYSADQITDNLLNALQYQLKIKIKDCSRDALASKTTFKSANSSDWWIDVTQIDSTRSKVLFSATAIFGDDFEKYMTGIIQALEKQLQHTAQPAESNN